MQKKQIHPLVTELTHRYPKRIKKTGQWIRKEKGGLLEIINTARGGEGLQFVSNLPGWCPRNFVGEGGGQKRPK